MISDFEGGMYMEVAKILVTDVCTRALNGTTINLINEKVRSL